MEDVNFHAFAPFLGAEFLNEILQASIKVGSEVPRSLRWEVQGWYRNTTGTISDLHGPPGGSFMHICNDPQIGTVENAASVPI